MTAQVQSIAAFTAHETPPEEPILSPESMLNRREFFTYAWGAALGLVAVESAAATFFYLWPRFRPGEFGGKFELGPAAMLPPIEAAPEPNMAGKFWLVNTAAGPKALYMVCTHLGCLYKWDTTDGIFKCPCHGSQFDREGNRLQGPAPRGLDQFRLRVSRENQIVVDTGDKIIGRASEE